MSLKVMRLAILINNKLYNSLYKISLEWDPDFVLLRRVKLDKFNLYYADQFLILFLYGIVACTYCAIREILNNQQEQIDGIGLLRFTFFLAAIINSISQTVTNIELEARRKEIVAGMNALLNYKRTIHRCKETEAILHLNRNPSAVPKLSNK